MFEQTGLSLDGYMELWRIIAIVTGGTIYIFFSYRGLRLLKVGRIAVLFFLRTVLLLIMILLIGEAAIKVQSYSKEKAKIAILVDSSKSMGMRSSDSGRTRLEAVMDFFKGNSEFMQWMGNNFLPEYYRVDSETKELSLDNASGIVPLVSGTDLKGALDYVRARHSPEDLSAVVLFSDGLDTEGMKETVSSYGMKYGVPVFTISPGSSAKKDVALLDLKSSGFAIVGENYHVEFDITMNGWKTLNVTVSLRNESTALLTRTVKIKDGETQRLKFEFNPQKGGKAVYTIEVPVYDGEEFSENNRLTFVLTSIVNTLRVMLLSGKPSWELRFLREAMKSNPWVDLVNFNILRTTVDFVNVPERELSLIPFPADEIFQKGLDSFDVFIILNFETEQFVPSSYLGKVVDFVKNGGGFAIIGGSLLSRSRYYAGTPMEEVVPVFPGGGDYKGEFGIKPAPGAFLHPLLAPFREEDIHLENLPKMDFLNAASSIKKWAVPVIVSSADNKPVIVAGSYGKGRIMTVLSDSLWRLGINMAADGRDPKLFNSFWRNALNWLSGARGMDNFIVEPESDEFMPGNPVRLRLNVLDRLYRPVKNGEMKIIIKDAVNEKIMKEKILSVEEANNGVIIESLPEGTYRVAAEIIKNGRTEETRTAGFIVRGKAGEMDSPFSDEEFLKNLAESTGGSFYRIQDKINRLPVKPGFIKKITGEKKKRIWNHRLFYFSTIIILSAEWFLRRRWRLG